MFSKINYLTTWRSAQGLGKAFSVPHGYVGKKEKNIDLVNKGLTKFDPANKGLSWIDLGLEKRKAQLVAAPPGRENSICLYSFSLASSGKLNASELAFV